MLPNFPSDGGAFFASLDPQLFEKVERAAVRKSVSDGLQIHGRGDPADSVTFIESGSIRLSNVGIDGKRITTVRLGSGSAFGLLAIFAGGPRSHDAHAIGETELLVLSARRFIRLIDQEPAIRDRLLTYLSIRLTAALSGLEDERRLPLGVRLAKLLIRIGGTSGVVERSQESIARELAASRVAVGTAIQELKRKGFLSTGYRQLVIQNSTALQAWVDSHLQLFEER